MLLQGPGEFSRRQIELNKALKSAAERGDDSEIEALVVRGAQVNAPDSKGNTAAHRAAGIGTDHYSPGRSGHISTIRILMLCGADLTLPNRDGLTVLGHANVRRLLELNYPRIRQ